MHDLHTINRLNDEAFGSGIHTARASGKHVVVYKNGLHTVAYSVFASQAEAEHYAETQRASRAPGTTYLVLAPFGDAPVPQSLTRDQSEDRTVTPVAYREVEGKLVEEPLV